MTTAEVTKRAHEFREVMTAAERDLLPLMRGTEIHAQLTTHHSEMRAGFLAAIAYGKLIETGVLDR